MPPKKRIIRHTLPEREMGICFRLRYIRDRLSLSQSEVANQLRISRERLASYEDGRVSVKAGFALRFCRQFIVSEAWLALGEDEMFRRLSKTGHDSVFKDLPGWYQCMRRMCKNLLCKKECKLMDDNFLFSEAWDKCLEKVYNSTGFRCQFTDVQILPSDNEDMIQNYFSALMEMWKSKLDKTGTARLLYTISELAEDTFRTIQEGHLTPTEEDLLLNAAYHSGVLSDEDFMDDKKSKAYLASIKEEYLAQVANAKKADGISGIVDD